jgi:uncharacterized damage-inducible protein DinB
MRRSRVASCAALAFLAAFSPSALARAQQPAAPFSDVTRSAWYSTNDLLLAAAKKMPEEHYGFRPAKDTRTFGEIIGHLASEHYALCSAVTGRRATVTGIEKLTAKEALVGVLQDSIALCDMAYGLLTDENASFRYFVFNTSATRLQLLTDTVTHDNEHYGNLATYMRIKGVTPPGRGQ